MKIIRYNRISLYIYKRIILYFYNMNYDIVEIITEHIYTPIKIIEWFNMKYINIEKIITNTSCTPEFIEKNIHLLNYKCWKKLCLFTKYKSLINKNYDSFNNELVSLTIRENQNIDNIVKKDNINECFLLNVCKSHSINLNIISKNINKLDSSCWYFLLKNPYAIGIIKKHINIYNITDNDILFPIVQNYNAIDIILLNLHNFNNKMWQYLCVNKNAIDIIIQNIDKITIDGFHNLALNNNPRVMQIIKDNYNVIKDDTYFWKLLSGNPNIFIFDKEEYKNNIDSNYKNIFNKINYNELYNI